MSEKKRTTYQKGSTTSLPKHIDQTKYGYRWVSANNLAENTDYYDPRGWELDKTEDGKNIRRGDLLLARMPIDMHEAMKADKEDARKSQQQHLADGAANEDAALEHAFKKSGGRIKSDFTLTKN